MSIATDDAARGPLKQSSRASNKRFYDRFAVLLVFAIAFLWGYAGCVKLGDVLAIGFANPARWISGAPLDSETDWVSTFPALLILVVTITEILAAWWLASGKTQRGLLTGIVLLGLFFVTFQIRPIEPGTSCGCMGGGSDLPGTPTSRLALLGGIHAIAFALTWQRS